MSIHERMSTKTGKRTWEVRYRQGGRNRSRTFKTEHEARVFDGEIASRAVAGTVSELHAGTMALNDFVEVWWEKSAKRRLKKNTLRNYACAYNNHIYPYLGEHKVRAISPRAVDDWRSQLEDNNVGGPTIRTAMVVLQSCLTYAVVRGEIQANPVKEVPKPSRERKQEVRPYAPAQVERMREALLERRCFRDATFISVLAYAGLRPGEARGLEWQHIRKNTILTEQADAVDEVKSTKTENSRTVKLVPALRHDLEWWRAHNGYPTEGFVFESTKRPGKPWPEEAYKSWSQKGYKATLRAAGIPMGRPYDLRHSFASLLIHSGNSVVDTARQLGHSASVCLDTYGHVFDELGDDRRPISEVMADARREVFGNPDGPGLPLHKDIAPPRLDLDDAEAPTKSIDANNKRNAANNRRSQMFGKNTGESRKRKVLSP